MNPNNMIPTDHGARIEVSRLSPALTLDFLNRQYAVMGQSETHADIQGIMNSMLTDALATAAQEGGTESEG